MNTELHITDQRLEPIAAKVLAGERLAAEDGLTLYESSDLLAIGWVAKHVRGKRHRNNCYFNINRHINPTNVCGAHCKLCAFGRDNDAAGAYTYSLDEIWHRAGQGVAEGATEFHIVGGLHPDLPFSFYLDMIRGLKQRFPCVTRCTRCKRPGSILFPAAVRKFSIRAFGKSFATTRRAGACGWISRGPLTRSDCARMRRCCTGTLRRRKNASSTYCCCANCRTARKVFRRLSRWRFIRTIRRSIICRSRRASMIWRRWRFRGCCSIIS